MAQRIQDRRGTAAAWTAANPILAAGESGYETDTGKWKYGDGATAWATLGYQPSPADLAGVLADLGNKVDTIDLDTLVASEINTTGSETRTALSATFARVVTPEKHGAIGDGATDDRAAFVAAAAELSAAGGGVLHCKADAYYFATDFELTTNNVQIVGKADRGTQFLFAPAAQFRTKPGAVAHDYQVQRLVLENVMFYPATSAARSKPTVQINDALYVTARNCTFYGDTPETQPALKMQATLYSKFDKCDFWGGSVGILGGDTGTNSPNDLTLNSCNFNGSAKAIDGVFFTLNVRGGSCQSVTDGFVISGNVAQASSTVNIEGVYFEAVTGRCIDAGSLGYVYNLRVVGNYIAALSATTEAPVYLKNVVGYTVENNHWSGYDASVTGFAEVGVAASGGFYFPRKGSIQKNVTPYTDERGQYAFTTGTSADDKGQSAGANAGFGAGRRILRSRPMDIAAAGTVNAVIFDDAKNRFIHSVKLICEETFDGAANFTMGVAVAPGFHVDTTALTSHAASTLQVLTVGNAPTRPANGFVFARIAATAVTTPGTFVVEVEYSEAA